MKKRKPKNNSCDTGLKNFKVSPCREVQQIWEPPPKNEVKELTELDTTIMTTSTNNIYVGGHLLGVLPWAEEDAI